MSTGNKSGLTMLISIVYYTIFPLSFYSECSTGTLYPFKVRRMDFTTHGDRLLRPSVKKDITREVDR